MGCVLQPDEFIPAAALKPGDTTSDAVQPGQAIDICVVPVLEVVTLTNVTRLFQTPDASPNDSSLGYEIQPNGFVVAIESADTGAGPPSFIQLNNGTDWIIPRPPIAAYHGRWNQTGGAGVPDISSSAENVWIPLGNILIDMQEQGINTHQIIALVEISDDAGATTLASAVVDITLDITP